MSSWISYNKVLLQLQIIKLKLISVVIQKYKNYNKSSSGLCYFIPPRRGEYKDSASSMDALSSHTIVPIVLSVY